MKEIRNFLTERYVYPIIRDPAKFNFNWKNERSENHNLATTAEKSDTIKGIKCFTPCNNRNHLRKDDVIRNIL